MHDVSPDHTGSCCQREPYDLLNIVEDLVSGDSDGLDEELVAAFGICGRLCLHHLKEDCQWMC